MSLPDVVRNVAKSVRDAFSDRDGLKAKAKDLPMNVLQTTLSGVGQALLFGDRLRTRLKRIGTKDEAETSQEAVKEAVKDKEKAEGREALPDTTAEGVKAEAARTAAGEETSVATKEAKPARREPVIFAPRPEKAAETEKPEKREEPEKAEAPQEPEPAKAAEVTDVTDVTETVEPAEAPKAKPAGPAVVAEPTAKVAEPVAEPAVPAVTAEPAKTEPAGTDLIEPMPNYAELSMASLRARLRGKSAEEVRALLAYEQATADRANIIKMYENRLAKIAESRAE
ncbi:hypothetical protein C1I98_08635 [Spongiactinospora gelatinilytica]|uniref:Lipid droplet-associated protein n=1 Tax=Spongiactinospora gelatinilytica TaxID=2666298 RepID=A0A2W2INJ5_9ACTN|nr:hypothetical protein [Spongiactinospora gelatinilytica]PZG51434.1 hypothetical protein C1I98_08635 [Spongiactinospora gelatinilytica]